MTNLIQELLKENLVTRDQVNDAGDKQLGAKKPLQELLVDMGFLKEEDLLRVASRLFRTPVIDLEKETVDESLTDLLPYALARKYGVFPVKKTDEGLVIAMSDPQNIIAMDELKLKTGLDIRPVLCSKSGIITATEKHYHLTDATYDLVKNISDNTKIETLGPRRMSYDAGSEDAAQAPTVRLLNLTFGDAINMRASDIHIEPQEKSVIVRYRIDGYLKNIITLPKEAQNGFLARLKILAELDIAETKKTQDGRVRIKINGREIDLRVSLVPTFYGEKAVLRLLDPNAGRAALNTIIPPDKYAYIASAIAKPQGLALITGPTGSGKTTTLYAMLDHLKNETKNIVTVEDPVEYVVPGLNQIQIDTVKGVTFANALRSILRQDPNIILVGEIRDLETADIAFKASQTGHFVLSTLHTNNSVATVTRLFDIGLEPFIVSSSLIFIAAQRLVRLICPHCKESYTPDAEMLEKFGGYLARTKVAAFYKGKGCQRCGFTGYLGRTSILEVLKINDRIKKLISEKASEAQLLAEAKNDGFVTLAEQGMGKVGQGLTTLDEILRIAEIKAPEAPAAEPEKPAPAAGPAARPADTGAPRVLIVDDEPDLLKILAKRLKDAGYAVTQAVNGAAAVELALKERFDLIITDIMMPVMNGIEAVKLLRSKMQTAAVPIIMLTAKKDKETELESFDLGADDYITKPYDTDKLLARIKMLIRKRGG